MTQKPVQTIEDFLGWLSGQQVDDVFMTGYTERFIRDRAFFHMWNTSLYFSTPESFLCIDDWRTMGQLRLSLADSFWEAEADVEGLMDESEEFLPISLKNQLLADNRDYHTLTSARYVLSDDSDPERGIVNCMELVFDYSTYLFISAEIDGLLTGGYGDYDHWTGYLYSHVMPDRWERSWQAPC